MSERSAAWTDYLAAAQRLDTVRREAADVAATEAAAVAAARDELPTVQARLGMQAARIVDLAGRAGAAPPALQPGPAEQRAAAQSVAGGPAVALAALRQARATVDVADAALARFDDDRDSSHTWRNLLIYGPLAAAVLAIQLVFSFLVDQRTRPFYAAGCGLTLAALAWAAGWLLVGVIYPRRPRTAIIGALVCFAPILFTTIILTAAWL
jgi:hypothetical protein